MKVNMTPNPLDVVTIHASQGDTEARQWEFELHNNGELIDTSDVTEQLFFKAYKGGTEQLLPENTSTPTTTPILADIQYPDGLRTDQYFTYRETPTTISNKARIKTIKGNTLVWNQKLNIGTLTATQGIDQQLNIASGFNFIANHKYLFVWNQTVTMQSNTRNTPLFNDGTTHYMAKDDANYNLEKGVKSWLFTASNTTSNGFIRLWIHTPNVDVPFTDFMLFDLTQMGLDITDPSDFTSLFPLSYYSYNQGSLLSFNGNGIKTVGFNQWDEEWEHGSLGNNGENTGSSSSPEIRSVNYIPILQNTAYYLKTPVVTIVHYYGSADLNNYKGNQYIAGSQLLNIPTGTNYIRFRTINTYGDYKNDICLNISDSSRNGQYEPYTSHTTNLPIATYFPTGMKSAGTVYDELTPRKAITRIGAVDLGTLSWSWQSTWQAWYTYQISTSLKGASNNDTKPNIVSANYPTLALNYILGTSTFGISISNVSTESKLIAVENGSDTVTPTGYLYYELATPTETSFTTASLVTENAEIPLSNEDGVLIGKCTEQLSENPGFIDAKIKLSDSDGECYSNKIQLHVERSPQ